MTETSVLVWLATVVVTSLWVTAASVHIRRFQPTVVAARSHPTITVVALLPCLAVSSLCLCGLAILSVSVELGLLAPKGFGLHVVLSVYSALWSVVRVIGCHLASLFYLSLLKGLQRSSSLHIVPKRWLALDERSFKAKLATLNRMLSGAMLVCFLLLTVVEAVQMTVWPLALSQAITLTYIALFLAAMWQLSKLLAGLHKQIRALELPRVEEASTSLPRSVHRAVALHTRFGQHMRLLILIRNASPGCGLDASDQLFSLARTRPRPHTALAGAAGLGGCVTSHSCPRRPQWSARATSPAQIATEVAPDRPDQEFSPKIAVVDPPPAADLKIAIVHQDGPADRLEVSPPNLPNESAQAQPARLAQSLCLRLSTSPNVSKNNYSKQSRQSTSPSTWLPHGDDGQGPSPDFYFLNDQKKSLTRLMVPLSPKARLSSPELACASPKSNFCSTPLDPVAERQDRRNKLDLGRSIPQEELGDTQTFSEEQVEWPPQDAEDYVPLPPPPTEPPTERNSRLDSALQNPTTGQEVEKQEEY
eukprot:g11680.t1